MLYLSCTFDYPQKQVRYGFSENRFAQEEE